VSRNLVKVTKMPVQGHSNGLTQFQRVHNAAALSRQDETILRRLEDNAIT
jgi:hypothetical protein